MSWDEGTSSAARGCVGGSFTSHDPSIEVSPAPCVGVVFLWTLHSMHFPCVFSRFIVLGRVRIRRTWTLARARSNREIEIVIRRRRRAVGGRDGDGIVMGHDSSCRGPRARPASSSLDSTRPIDSIGRTRARVAAAMMSCSFIHSFARGNVRWGRGDSRAGARRRDTRRRRWD